MNILQKIDLVYQKKIYKSLYTFGLSGLTFLLLIIIPTLLPRTNYIRSFWFDLLIRSIITYFFYKCYYFYSHLDRYYKNFYKGSENQIEQRPDKIKQLFNCLAALFVGLCFFFIYRKILFFFIQNINERIVIISSIFFGLMVSIPLLSQYKKR
jgi:hypothetical protein